MKRVIIALALLLFASQLVHGQTGQLDRTFGENGVTITSVDQKDAYGYQSVLLPDGKILQSGSMLSDDLGHEATVFRYDANGALDQSFGDHGRARFNSAWTIHKVKVVAYPDGKQLMYGFERYSPGIMPFVIRILSNGIIDSSFGEKGRYSPPSAILAGEFVDVVIASDSAILIVGMEGVFNGSVSPTKPFFRRLTADGHVDSTFGTNGTLILHLERDSLELQTVCKDGGGRYVFVCKSIIPFTNEIVVFRVSTDGVLDPSFGENGFAYLNPSNGGYLVPSVKILSDSSIIFNVNSSYGFSSNTVLVKLTKDGIPDESFGSHGISVPYQNIVTSPSNGLAIDAYKRIIVAGHTYLEKNGVTASLFRFHSDGVVDSSFGVDGIFRLFLDLNSEANDIVIQEDGKYIVTGDLRTSKQAFNSNYVSRVDPNATFGVNSNDLMLSSISLHPTPSTDNCTVTYTLPANGECTMSLRDESGREVRTFATSEYRTAGEHKEELDLRGLAAGVYFLQIESNGVTQTAKLIKQ